MSTLERDLFAVWPDCHYPNQILLPMIQARRGSAITRAEQFGTHRCGTVGSYHLFRKLRSISEQLSVPRTALCADVKATIREAAVVRRECAANKISRNLCDDYGADLIAPE